MNRLVVAVAVVAGLGASAANADPVTVNLFYTTFSGGTNVHEVTATQSGSSLSFSNNTGIASTNGADGLLFAPDGNLLVAGQNANFPAQVHEITTAGASVANANTAASSNGSYHLALSSSAPNATLYSMCNGNCGNNLTAFTLSGGGLVNNSTGTAITVSGGTSQDIRGIVFNPNNSTWYYGTANDGSTAGTFGKISFSGTTATLTQLLSGVPAHGLTFDPFTGDIIFSSANQVQQFDPTTGLVVSTVTTNMGDAFDQSAVDGQGHLFVASNNGDLLAIDYDITGLIGTGTSAEKFLAGSLDDIAPLSGIGSITTPLPSALPLFATGLGALGLLGWRRKRKAQAAA
jgi:hypothetical protein